MRRRSTQRGVTLLELIIVVTLLSLLTVGMAFTIRIGFNTLDHTNAGLAENRRVLGAQRILDQQVAGLIPVVFSCNSPTAGGVLFFEGTAGSMRFVSRYTLEEAARGFPRVIEYFVIPGNDNRGVRLVMNEFYYTGPGALMPLCAAPAVDPITGFPRLIQPQPSSRSFVLADQLAYCRLSYLVNDPRTRQRGWLPRPVGGRLPEAVRIEMAPFEPDPARVQMATMTLPIRVNRDPQQNYEDIDQPPNPQ